MCSRSRRISPVETVDPNYVVPPWENRWRFNLFGVILLRQYLWFRTPVVAVDPEQAIMDPVIRIRKFLSGRPWLGYKLFLLTTSTAPLGCGNGASTLRNVSARQARPLHVTDINLTAWRVETCGR